VVVLPHADAITWYYLLGRLDRVPVEFHMPSAYRICGFTTSFKHTHCPHPASMRTGSPSVSAVVFVDNLLNLYPIGNAADDSHDQTNRLPEPEATSEHKCGKHAATKPNSNRDDTIACVLANLLLFYFDGIIRTGLHCHGIYPSRLITLYYFHPLGASFFRFRRGLCEPSDEIQKRCFFPWGHG